MARTQMPKSTIESAPAMPGGSDQSGAERVKSRHVPREGTQVEKPDQLADWLRECESRQEALLDEALDETFPSSDPISPEHVEGGEAE